MPMPRYFFNVHTEEHVARDPVGVELPDLAEAINQAKAARAEIIEDDLDRLWLEIPTRTAGPWPPSAGNPDVQYTELVKAATAHLTKDTSVMLS